MQGKIDIKRKSSETLLYWKNFFFIHNSANKPLKKNLHIAFVEIKFYFQEKIYPCRNAHKCNSFISSKIGKIVSKKFKNMSNISGSKVFPFKTKRDMNIGDQFQNGNIVHSLQYLSNFKLCWQNYKDVFTCC